MPLPSDAYDQIIHWVAVANTEAEAIPPYAAMEVFDVDDHGVAQVRKPTVDHSTDILFNGSTPIPQYDTNPEWSGFGKANSSFPAKAAFVQDDPPYSDPSGGEVWGVKAGDWYLHRGKTGFKITKNVATPNPSVDTESSGPSQADDDDDETSESEAESVADVNVGQRTQDNIVSVVRETTRRLEVVDIKAGDPDKYGRLPGRIQSYDTNALQWVDQNEDIWVVSLKSTSNPSRDIGIHLGFANGRPVYGVGDLLLSGSGSGGHPCLSEVSGVSLNSLLGRIIGTVQVLCVDEVGCMFVASINQCPASGSGSGSGSGAG